MKTGKQTVNGDYCRMRMGQAVTTRTLPGIQNALLRELSVHSEVEIDFSDVVVVDTAGIKAILALRREAVRKNKFLRFTSSSAPFLQLLELMNQPPAAGKVAAA